MVAGTVYLDVDDEITSAAARIRTSESPKVGLVVPYGSRISTSRMNFRLLSREAIVNNRRLSIIAGDPATRALAASAGLAVFATVGEYESALAGPPVSVDDYDGLRTERSEPIAPVEPAVPVASPPAASSEATDRAPTRTGTRSGRPPRGTVGDETQAIALPAAGGAVAGAGAAQAATTAPVVAAVAAAAAPAPTIPVVPSPRPDTTGPAGRLPVRGAIGRVRIGTPVLVGAAAALLALAVVAVGAYLILPAADITVTPREQAIEPFTLTVTADPAATAVDPVNDVIPALTLDMPVEVSDTFTTVGKRVELTAATASVTFSNYDPTASNTVPAGSVLSTEGGIRFKTLRVVNLPRADFQVGLPITPSRRSVAVAAVKSGPTGNVPANSIRVVPREDNPEFLKVNNPDPANGGARKDFPKIDQKEVDAALAALQTKLDAAFSAAVKEGTGAPAATTIFPETAILGVVTRTTDPTKLVGQEVETFDLGLSASGTVIAVDAAPVAEIARSRLTANIGAGYRLVDGSDKIVQGDPVVASGVVTFPVTARAARVRILDPEELRAMVKGKPTDQARALLEPYGEVKIDTWPAWVSSITGVDSRLNVTIGGPGSSSGAAGSPSPAGPGTSAAPAASAAP